MYELLIPGLPRDWHVELIVRGTLERYLGGSVTVAEQTCRHQKTTTGVLFGYELRGSVLTLTLHPSAHDEENKDPCDYEVDLAGLTPIPPPVPEPGMPPGDYVITSGPDLPRTRLTFSAPR